MHQKHDYANVVVNKFIDLTELIVYKEPFIVNANEYVDTSIDRTRKFIYNENNILTPINDNVKITQLKQSLKNSRKRALDNVYGYALCNDWNYFITLTFSEQYVDRFDLNGVNNLWKIFREKMQYYYSDIKILLVNEKHKSGAIHFHGFIGNCNFDEHLIFAKNNRKYLKDKNGKTKLDINGNKVINAKYGEVLRTKFGDMIFNFKNTFYNYGYTTIVKIRPESSNLQITNYLTKYLSKDNNQVEYNKKSYYRTHNLNFKNKMNSYLHEQDINNLLSDSNFNIKKATEKFIVLTTDKTTKIPISKTDVIRKIKNNKAKELIRNLKTKEKKASKRYVVELSPSESIDLNILTGNVNQFSIDDIF